MSNPLNFRASSRHGRDPCISRKSSIPRWKLLKRNRNRLDRYNGAELVDVETMTDDVQQGYEQYCSFVEHDSDSSPVSFDIGNNENDNLEDSYIEMDVLKEELSNLKQLLENSRIDNEKLRLEVQENFQTTEILKEELSQIHSKKNIAISRQFELEREKSQLDKMNETLKGKEQQANEKLLKSTEYINQLRETISKIQEKNEELTRMNEFISVEQSNSTHNYHKELAKYQALVEVQKNNISELEAENEHLIEEVNNNSYKVLEKVRADSMIDKETKLLKNSIDSLEKKLEHSTKMNSRYMTLLQKVRSDLAKMYTAMNEGDSVVIYEILSDYNSDQNFSVFEYIIEQVE